jgi:hypothetical protein
MWGFNPTRAILTPPLGTLLQTPPRRAHLALLREILGSRTCVLGGVIVSRFATLSASLAYTLRLSSSVLSHPPTLYFESSSFFVLYIEAILPRG